MTVEQLIRQLGAYPSDMEIAAILYDPDEEIVDGDILTVKSIQVVPNPVNKVSLLVGLP